MVASGEITAFAEEPSSTPKWARKPSITDVIPASDDVIMLDADDIYKELRIRGYDYGPIFKIIQTLNHEGTK